MAYQVCVCIAFQNEQSGFISLVGYIGVLFSFVSDIAYFKISFNFMQTFGAIIVFIFNVAAILNKIINAKDEE